MKSSRAKGKEAENLAKQYLLDKELRYIDCNFESEVGEIDLIFFDEKEKQLVFVEVKSKDNLDQGYPEQQVTKQKLYRITKTADFFMDTHPHLPQFGRIDVVAISFHKSKPEIIHFQNIY